MKDKEVSGKHITLRVILFILALVIGVSAFGIGIYHITNRETGYYEITATRDETAPMYSNGYSFYCYIDGKSNEIKSNLTKIGSLYSESLGRISRLLDARETYDGYINLATLNARPNEDVKLPAELYEVLADALERTKDTEITILDGAEKGLWQELLYLEEPQPFDPVNDAYSAERIRAAREAILSPDAVRLVLSDAESHIVRLEVSESYRAVMERYEIDMPIVDLGVLREAYTLRYVYRQLVENGISKGYLKTESGLCMMLPETETGGITIIGYADGRPKGAAELPIVRGDASCALRTFSLGEAGYYECDGILRHPYPGPEAEPNPDLLTVCTLSQTGDIVGATIDALRLFAVPREETAALAATLAGGRTVVMFLAADAPYTVFVDAQHAHSVTPVEKSGYSVSVP